MDHNQPIAFSKVRINDAFWSERQKVNATASILKQYAQCEETGRLEALLLKWKKGEPKEPHVFWDSDTAKWLEAACFIYATTKDSELYGKIDRVADLFIGAQQPDGYINSHFTVVEPENRWKNLRDCHELYCAGHLFEAAVAHSHATGESKLLDCACRFADYIDSVFGMEEGKIRGYCGHEEVELALVKLYRATHKRKYLDLAAYFVNQRGVSPHYFELERAESVGADAFENVQSHKPVREQKEAVGHAVRAVYLYSAMADLARELGDESLGDACKILWRDVVGRKMYITGGIGSSKKGEAFGAAYDLPNEVAYCETCASVGLVMWAHRMSQIDLDSEYADIVEKAIYNGALSGMSLDGKKFFYENPLASTGGHHRKDWYDCSCCPSNISRLLASLGGYIYSTKKDELIVHQFMGGDTSFELENGVRGNILQSGDYVWSGKMKIIVETEKDARWKLLLRIPSWVKKYSMRINGDEVCGTTFRKGYAILERTWKFGDRVELDFSMDAQIMMSNPRVTGNAGLVALQRGAFVYCIEDADFDEVNVHEVSLFLESGFVPRQDVSTGLPLIALEGECVVNSQASTDELYSPMKEVATKAKFRAIPYFAWDNRMPGGMRVWMPCHVKVT